MEEEVESEARDVGTTASGEEIDAEYEIDLVAVDEVKFNQDLCGGFFIDGKSTEDSIQDSMNGTMNPLEADFLILNVVNGIKDGVKTLWRSDNKRFWRRKEYQKRLRKQS